MTALDKNKKIMNEGDKVITPTGEIAIVTFIGNFGVSAELANGLSQNFMPFELIVTGKGI